MMRIIFPSVLLVRCVLLLIAMFVSVVFVNAQGETEVEKQRIHAASEFFSAAYMRGDVKALMDCYAEDAVIMPGGTDIISHRDSIRKYWTIPPGRAVTYHRSTSVGITVVGNTAYDYGYYEGAHAQGENSPVPFKGKYVIVWVKGKDMKWRMKVDIWNTVAPQQ